MPSDVLPSLKVTVPPLSNVPEPAVTVAVKVTAWPNTDDGVTDEVTVVVEFAVVTICGHPADWHDTKLASPP